MVFATVIWAVAGFGVLRLPTGGLIWLIGPMMSTVASLAAPTRLRRMTALVFNLMMFGVFQLVFAALEPNYLVKIAIMPLLVYLSSFRNTGNNSGALMVASIFEFGQGNFELGVDNLVICAYLAAVAAPSCYVLDWAFFGKYVWPGAPPAPRLTLDAVVRRSVAFMTAVAAYNALQWQFAYWIPLTVGLSYSSGLTGRAAQKLAMTRAVLAPIGFSIAVIWMSTLDYGDYQFNYLGMVFIVFGVYYNFRAGDYVGYYLMFTVMLSGFSNLAHGTGGGYGNGWQLISQSCFFVAVGALIVVLAEERLEPIPEKNIAGRPENT